MPSEGINALMGDFINHNPAENELRHRHRIERAEKFKQFLKDHPGIDQYFYDERTPEEDAALQAYYKDLDITHQMELDELHREQSQS